MSRPALPLITWAATAALLLPACQVGKSNPHLPMSALEARASLSTIKSQTPSRPIVILSGWREPGICAARIAPTFQQAFGKDQVLSIQFFTGMSFDSNRARVIKAIEERWPSPSLDTTIEVDVIGHSMGGLVAKYAALPDGTTGLPTHLKPSGRQLKIAKLFTIATPHRGARLAPLPFIDPTARDMIPGSEFLTALDTQQQHADYKIIPYVINADIIVGRKKANPADQPSGTPELWLPQRFPLPSHLNAMGDPRITANILQQITPKK